MKARQVGGPERGLKEEGLGQGPVGRGRGLASPYEAAASHAETLAALAAGCAIQDAAKAVVEGVPHGQAVEVALVGRWGPEESVGQGFFQPSCRPRPARLPQKAIYLGR